MIERLRNHRAFYPYIAKDFLTIIILAIRRTRFNRSDLRVLMFILSSPILHLARFRGVLATPIGKVVIIGDESLRAIVYGLFKSHFCDIPNLRYVSTRKTFPIIVDVGANLGDFTLAMCRDSAKIVAIEPSSENFLNLRLNIRANALENVILQNLAAHSGSGLVVLTREGSSAHITSSGDGEAVKGERIDSLLESLEIEAVDILKIDVQGHEIPTILGMSEYLKKKSVKLLVVEVHPKKLVSVDEVCKLMMTYGYALAFKDNYLFHHPHLYFGPSHEGHDPHFS